MKVVIERSALIKTLSHVQSVVERRNTIPILSNVLLEAQDGRLKMTATDLDIQIVDSAEADVINSGKTTVAAQIILDIVKKLNDGSQVQLEMVDNRLRVTSGRSRFHIPSLPADDFPNIQRGEMEHEFTLKTEDLEKGFERTRYAMSTEETRYYLNGIYFHVIDGELIAAATDGHRLSKTKISTGESSVNGMPNVIIPRKAVGEIVKIMGEYDGEIQVGVSKSKVTFDIGHLSLVTKTVDGNFPDYERVIPQNNHIRIKTDVATLSETIDRVSTIASEKTKAVRVNVDNQMITLSVTSPENGTAKDEIPCSGAGEIEIGFNSKYLSEILRYVESEEVELSFETSSSPVMIRDLDRPEDVNVIMPMRV
jgi:DNA polymerase-3 subunit beta